MASKDAFWINCKVYQLWRFIILNFKIIKGVEHSKRLPKFVIKYKVSYVVTGAERPPTINNTRRPPQAGDRVQLGRDEFEVIEVLQTVPPSGEFCFLQATCKSVENIPEN
ncbi:MAG: hypothetical protein WBN03_03585 [Desulfobacterales bacterium]